MSVEWAYVVGLVGLVACGPTVPGPSGPGSGTSAAETEEASASGAQSGGTSTGIGTGIDEVGESSSSGAPVPMIPMFGACEGGGPTGCLAGLECTPIALPEGTGSASICTAQCHDPALDCATAPDGFEAVCNGFFHDAGPDPFCAIGCTAAGECPAGMECGMGGPFTEPYYCVPP